MLSRYFHLDRVPAKCKKILMSALTCFEFKHIHTCVPAMKEAALAKKEKAQVMGRP